MAESSSLGSNYKYEGVYRNNGGQMFNVNGSTVNADNINFYGSSQENYQCLKDLRANGTDPEEDRTRIRHAKDELVKDSCDWIWNNATFHEWFNNTRESKGILRIAGDAGKGKTMIMLGLVDQMKQRLSQESSKSVLAYFFCQATDARLNNGTSILKGLLYSILCQHRDLLEHLMKRYETSGESLFKGAHVFSSMQNILSDVLSDTRFTNFYILVDALDECLEGLEDFLRFIMRSTRQIGTEKIRWLVTSRNRPDVEEQLGSYEVQLKISLERNQLHVKRVIDEYIEAKVSDLARIKMYSPELEEKVGNTLRAKAGDTFLWVHLVCKELESPKTKSWKTLSILERVPTGLEATYDMMFRLIKESDDEESIDVCLRILQVATLVQRPLHLLEYSTVARLPTCDISEMEVLVNTCGSFLSVQENTVYFLHQSAKDYLAAVFDDRFANPNARLIRHQNIFENCLERLMELEDNMFGFKWPNTSVYSLNQFQKESILALEYSCCNWAFHLGSALAVSKTYLAKAIEMIKVFFYRSLLNWLEALCFLGQLSESVNQIALLQKFLLTGESASNFKLRFVVDEASRFIKYHQGTIQNLPLQIYSSALLFTPAGSWIRRRFVGKVPKWIIRLPHTDHDWDPCIRIFEGHQTVVSAVAFSKDDCFLASGDLRGEILLWNLISGTISGGAIHQMGSVTSLSFSSDSLKLAATGWHEGINVFDMISRKQSMVLPGETAKFSPDSLTLATNGAPGGNLCLIDATSAKILKTFGSSYDKILSIEFTSDGKYLISGSEDKVLIWNIDFGSCETVLSTRSIHAISEYEISETSLSHEPVLRNRVPNLTVSSDSQLMAYGSGDFLYVWDLHNKVIFGCMGPIHQRDPFYRYSRLAFSPIHQEIACADNGGNIKVYNKLSLKHGRPDIPFSMFRHPGAVTDIAYSRDGMILASSCDDYAVRLWNTDLKDDWLNRKPRWCHPERVTRIEIVSKGKMAWSRCRKSLPILWQTSSSEKISRPQKGILMTGDKSIFAVSQDGGMIVAISEDMVINLWDLIAHYDVRHRARLFSSGFSQKFWRGAIFSPDGKTIAAFDNNNIFIWDTESQVAIAHLEHTRQVQLIAFSPDGNLLASGCEHGTVYIWEIDNQRCIDILRLWTEPNFLHMIVFSTDNHRIMIHGKLGFQLWDKEEGTYICKTGFRRLGSEICTNIMSFSPGGQYFYNGCDLKKLPEYKISSEANREKEKKPRYLMLRHDTEWLSFDSQDLVWFPKPYRPCSFDIKGDTIAIGCASGLTYSIKFDMDLLNKTFEEEE